MGGIGVTSNRSNWNSRKEVQAMYAAGAGKVNGNVRCVGGKENSDLWVIMQAGGLREGEL